MCQCLCAQHAAARLRAQCCHCVATCVTRIALFPCVCVVPDDGWANTSQAIQPWQPKVGFCDHSPIGGATEEDVHCTEDMGLVQQDTTDITNNWRQTIDDVQDAVVQGVVPAVILRFTSHH